MRRDRNFTKEESDWLMANYSQMGPLKCSEYLDRTRDQIAKKAWKLNLKCKEMFDYSRFVFDINNPNFIYFLGFCWADGHVSKNGHKYDCSIKIIEADGVSLRDIFLNFADFKVSLIKKEGLNNQMCFYTRNQELSVFLFENDYMDKSYVEPTKILSKIPENLKHYFWRGFFDGDGCISNGISDPRNRFSLSISARAEYKWDEFIKLLGNKKFSLKIKKMNVGQTSIVTIWRQGEIIDFFHYLYPNLKFDIGLFRKYKKFCVCLRLYLKSFQRRSRLINGSVFSKKKRPVPRRKYFSAPKPDLKTLYLLFLNGDLETLLE